MTGAVMISFDSDPILSKLVRTANAGDFLFKQGEKSNTMYLIMEGSVVLMLNGVHAQRRVGTVGAGEMVGEKAILEDAPYKHTYSAVALTNVVMLELDKQSIKVIQKRMPDFTLKVLRRVTERLDEANELVSILQLKNEVERLTQYLLFFCHYHCKKGSRGVQISMSVDEIHEAINLDKTFIEASIKVLVAQKILVATDGGFLISDENALTSFLPTLKERLAA
jgi:CRP-like cAMP-binding protein